MNPVKSEAPTKAKPYIMPHEQPLIHRVKRRAAAIGSATIQSWRPIVVHGITFRERKTIGPDQYGLLDVDPAYQRGKTSMVPHIVQALRAGGSIPDTPDVAVRPWSNDPKRLWIMDGFQRICALQELDTTFVVNIHESDGLDAEKAFFLAMNNRRHLTSNNQVKAWDGPVVDLLRALNINPEKVTYGRIEMEGVSPHRLSAATLVKGVERLLSEKRNQFDIQKTLSRTDKLLGNNTVKHRATVFCELMALVFPKAALHIATMALAEVAYERWNTSGKVMLPSPAAIKKIRAINWRAALPSLGSANTDIAVTLLKRYWK